MKVAYICPHKYWNFSHQGDFYMLLAHWDLPTEEICSLRERKLVVLDNGAYELGTAIDDKVYHDVIGKVKPHVIILPDVYRNGSDTIKRSLRFLDAYYTGSAYPRYMGCVQGQTWKEWIECYTAFIDDTRISEIGIASVPYAVSPLCRIYKKDWRAFSRVEALRLLEGEGLLQKPIHILGSIDPIELPFLSLFSYVERTDSKIAFWNGVFGDRLFSYGLRKNSEKYENMSFEFDQGKLSRTQTRIIIHNMRVFRMLANGGEKWEREYLKAYHRG